MLRQRSQYLLPQDRLGLDDPRRLDDLVQWADQGLDRRTDPKNVASLRKGEVVGLAVQGLLNLRLAAARGEHVTKLEAYD